jgi:hypothetical protein
MPHRAFIAAAVALLCLLPASAPAHEPAAPKITGKPAISGTAQEGETLAATATWTGDPAPTVAWRWARCTAKGDKCTPIAGAASDHYVVTKLDVGATLRVRVTVTNEKGSDQARSEPSAVITAAPAPPPPPSPAPYPSPSPSPLPSPSTSPAPVPLGPTGGSAVASQPALLAPFPVVRLRGSLTRTGARIDLFTVRVPANVLVAVRCRGSSCPSRRLTRRVSTRRTLRLRRFERRLRAGTRLTVKVTSAGRIGKWSAIVIRRGAAPRRSDLCAYPDAGAPAPCPR